MIFKNNLFDGEYWDRLSLSVMFHTITHVSLPHLHAHSKAIRCSFMLQFRFVRPLMPLAGTTYHQSTQSTKPQIQNGGRRRCS
jgi:hypothetical protein